MTTATLSSHDEAGKEKGDDSMDETSHEPGMVGRFLRTHAVRIVTGVVLLILVCGVMSVYVPYQREQRIARKIETLEGAVNWHYRGPDWVPLSWRDRMSFCDRIATVGLDGRELPADLFSELGSLTNLDWLSLSGTKFREGDLKSLKGLTGLETLQLSQTDVTDAGLEHLKGLTSLRQLMLDHTVVTGAGLEHLKGLVRLKELYLHHTHVADAGLESLKGLERLERLELYNTQVTDAGLEPLKGLTNLQYLFLQDTQVTAEGKASLRKVLPGCRILPEP
ncbi:MAG: hypothetical protein AABP62_05655 [Planctomycetota bacterium]